MSSNRSSRPRPERLAWQRRSRKAHDLCFWVGFCLVGNSGRNPMDALDDLAPLGRLFLDLWHQAAKIEGLAIEEAAVRILPEIRPRLERFGSFCLR
jgi:hypothetical protein